MATTKKENDVGANILVSDFHELSVQFFTNNEQTYKKLPKMDLQFQLCSLIIWSGSINNVYDIS